MHDWDDTKFMTMTKEASASVCYKTGIHSKKLSMLLKPHWWGKVFKPDWILKWPFKLQVNIFMPNSFSDQDTLFILKWVNVGLISS